MISAAAPSERLDAFTTAVRCVAELVHPESVPGNEAVDRLWATAEAAGVVLSHGEDLVQQRLAEAFANPIISNQDQPHLHRSSAYRKEIEEDEGPNDGDARPPEFSNKTQALLFAERHGHD
jgi:hypothetical protein